MATSEILGDALFAARRVAASEELPERVNRAATLFAHVVERALGPHRVRVLPSPRSANEFASGRGELLTGLVGELLHAALLLDADDPWSEALVTIAAEIEAEDLRDAEAD